jgi:alpha-1,3-rhamnosyl/mannosyltransferase
MRIAFDARMIEHTGIGTYIRGLLEGLASVPHAPERYVVFVPPACAGLVPAAPHVEVRTTSVPVYSLAEHTRWPHLVDAAGCDLLHVPHYNAPWAARTPIVATVHDLIHILFPGDMPSPAHAWVAHRWLVHTVRRARHVIAVSSATAADLQRWLAVPKERVTVVPHGLEPRFAPQDAAAVTAFRAKHGLPAEFLLYFGLRRPHKNLERLVRAFALFKQRAPGPLGLVLWGRGDTQDAARTADVQVRDTWLDAADVPLLYAAARGVVQPSLYEGFGLPPLEAMACGVPVLCSNGGALPEVVADAALVVDRLDVEAMASGLERLAHDQALRATLVARGHERARRFDWDAAARATRRVYAAALSDR